MSLRELPYYIIREIASYLPYDDVDNLCTILGFDARIADMRLYNLNKIGDPDSSIKIRRDFCVYMQTALECNSEWPVFNYPYASYTYYGYIRLFSSDNEVETFAKFDNTKIFYADRDTEYTYQLENLTTNYIIKVYKLPSAITIVCRTSDGCKSLTLEGYENILNDVLDTSKYPTFLSFNRELCFRLLKIPEVLNSEIHEKALNYFSKKSISL